MNPRETLNKIAEAIGVITNDAKEPIEKVEEVAAELPAAVEEAVEDALPAVEETVEEIKEEAPEAEAEAAEQAVEEAVEAPEAVEEKPEEEVSNESDDRVKELERQLNELKEILANALVEEDKEDAVQSTPEMPAEEPKGLTHSPEAEVASRRPKIAANGGSIQATVYRYMNNNK